MYRTKVKKIFWELDFIIMQNLSDIYWKYLLCNDNCWITERTKNTFEISQSNHKYRLWKNTWFSHEHINCLPKGLCILKTRLLSWSTFLEYLLDSLPQRGLTEHALVQSKRRHCLPSPYLMVFFSELSRIDCMCQPPVLVHWTPPYEWKHQHCPTFPLIVLQSTAARRLHRKRHDSAP